MQPVDELRTIRTLDDLAAQRGAGVRPWVLIGREVGRGPDDEPMVDDVAWVADELVEEATTQVESAGRAWESLRRS